MVFIKSKAALLCVTMRKRARTVAATIWFITFWYSFCDYKVQFFVAHFSNAVLHGKEAFPKASSSNQIVPYLVIFHLPYSQYRGVKIRFHSFHYQDQNFSLLHHSCRSCLTRVAQVWHSDLWNRLDHQNLFLNFRIFQKFENEKLFNKSCFLVSLPSDSWQFQKLLRTISGTLVFKY